MVAMLLVFPSCKDGEVGTDSDEDGLFTDVACGSITFEMSPFLDCTGIETTGILDGNVDNCKWLISSQDLSNDVALFYNLHILINNTVSLAEANFDNLIGNGLADNGSESVVTLDIGDEANFVSYALEGVTVLEIVVRESNATITLESIPVTDQDPPCTENQSVMVAFVEEILANL